MRPAVACAAGLAVAAAVALAAGAARADVQRYAVVVGHDLGAPDEQRLRFAETDAARVAELLGEVGGVPDENQVVLRGKPADAVRRALIATNERIRVDQRTGRHTVLVVYYSGHGDADALHLGDSRLPLRELEALVRGSSAQIRILVIDSCRSGSVTRVKGGKAAPPLALSAATEVSGEGLIVLTASTAGEDAQESDQLGGSFFTHYLLSALRGAADADGDQVITVGEAFRYTREQTILASSRTLGGTQHPTFHYDLRGRADIPLADLGHARDRGQLTVPDGATWLVLAASGTGVVGEIVAGAPRRTLSLRPGRYRVRGRARDALLEGAVTVTAGAQTVVDPAGLDRTTYARLVRKGHGDILRAVGGLFAGPLAQTAVIDGASTCLGGIAGWLWVRSDVTLSPRIAGCRGGFRNATLEATTEAFSLELRVAKVWDLRWISVDLGVAGGAELLRERFETRGMAPPRTSGAGHVGAGAGLSLPLAGRLSLNGELGAQTHFFSVERPDGARELVARFAARGVLALGAWF